MRGAIFGSRGSDHEHSGQLSQKNAGEGSIETVLGLLGGLPCFV